MLLFVAVFEVFHAAQRYNINKEIKIKHVFLFKSIKSKSDKLSFLSLTFFVICYYFIDCPHMAYHEVKEK